LKSKFKSRNYKKPEFKGRSDKKCKTKSEKDYSYKRKNNKRGESIKNLNSFKMLIKR